MATALSAPRHGSASLIPEAHGRPRAIVEFPQSLHMSTWPLIKSLLSSVTRCTNSKQVSFRPNTVSVTKCTKTSTPECGYAILTAGPFVTKSTKNVESRGSRRQNRSDILRDAQKFRTSGDVFGASSAEFVHLVTLRLRSSLPGPGCRRGRFRTSGDVSDAHSAFRTFGDAFRDHHDHVPEKWSLLQAGHLL